MLRTCRKVLVQPLESPFSARRLHPSTADVYLLFTKCFSHCFYSELYEKDFDGQSAIYWEVKYPFPLSNRDVSFWRENAFALAVGIKCGAERWKAAVTESAFSPEILLSKAIFPDGAKPQYVYVRERRDLDVDGRKIWVILARSSPETPFAEKSGVLRVKDYKQSLALESDGACGTKGDIRWGNIMILLPLLHACIWMSAWIISWLINLLTDFIYKDI